MSNTFNAIYDFELMPYALGDVLTWNVQTALRAQKEGRQQFDAFICVDPRYPAGIYQRGLVVAENCNLFFNELFGAYSTHPLPGNIHVYTNRDSMLDHLRNIATFDTLAASALADYENVLRRRTDEKALNDYFIQYIHSHEQLNAHFEKHGSIPYLVASRGCEPDVDGLLNLALADKRIVVIHPRLRRLDNGMAGEHTHLRDSEFLEWFEFVREAGKKRPDVQFVVVGRLQEKPLELLRLPNVLSLRTLGLGLGHELTLMLTADLFIGTSSGFASMANFSRTPYFVTKMSPEACFAYAIPVGTTRLPFAAPNQTLVYTQESAKMLMDLLEQGLSGPPARMLKPALPRRRTVDSANFQTERATWLQPAAMTSRFFTDDQATDEETAFLLLPKIEHANSMVKIGDLKGADAEMNRIADNFPRLATKLPELATIKQGNTLAPKRVSLAERLAQVNGRILPAELRGTRVHSFARSAKHFILSVIR